MAIQTIAVSTSNEIEANKKSHSMGKKPGKIGFVSLGCPKATVDSERILTQLRAEGYDLVNHYDNADMVIVNTCGFIDDAVKESLDTIQEALNENGKVIVTGCLGVKQDMINERFPNLLAVTGPQATDEVMTAVHKHLPPSHDPFMDLVPAGGMKLTPRHYAYLKISEGCNQKCTFCIIPTMRGKLVSRPISQVMREAEALVSVGVKELLIVSQDSGAYGVDVKYKAEFYKQAPLNNDVLTLAKALGSLGVWVRFHYLYPYPSIDKLIPLMAEGVILPYLDIPFQHASRSVLKAMKRPASQENVLKRIKAWREICPELVIRSTFIVGFPGETEADFQELLDFLQEAQLDRVGCFKYSPVEGAVANDIAEHVDEDVKSERFERLMELQAEISAQKLEAKIGYQMQVLIDDIIEEAFDDPSVDFAAAPPIVMSARSYMDAPEIDGVIHIINDDENFTFDMASKLKGTHVDVEIIAATDYDLIAKIIS